MFAECHICDTRQTLSMPSAASLALGNPRICLVPDLALGIRRPPPTLSRTTHTRTHNTHTHNADSHSTSSAPCRVAAPPRQLHATAPPRHLHAAAPPRHLHAAAPTRQSGVGPLRRRPASLHARPRAVRAPRSRPRRPPSTAPGLPPRPRRPRRSCWAGPATPELPGGCRAAGHAELPAGPRAPGHDAAAAGLAPRRRPRRSCWPGLAPPASLHCAAAAPPRRGVAGSHQPRHPSISNTRSKAQTCRSVTKHCILQCFAIFIFIDFDSCF